MRQARLAARARRAAPVLALLVVAGAARGLFLDRHALWGDELFSLAMATGHSLEHPASLADPAKGDFVEAPGPRPLAEYARYLEVDPAAGPARVVDAVRRSDTSPPLYYLLLAAWVRVAGTSDAAVRAFTALAALAALPLLAWLARRLGGRAAVVPVCALYALLPLSVYYGTEGRMYGLLLLCCAALIACALRLHERGSRGAAAGLVVAGAAGLLTHYFFLFLWAPLACWLLVWPGRARRATALGCAAVTALVAAPWYALLPELMGAWRVTGGWLDNDGPYQPHWPALLLWRQVSLRGTWDLVPRRFEALQLVALVALALAARRLPRPSRPIGGPRGLLWAAALAPPLGVVVFDLLQGTQAACFPRFGLAALPAVVLLLGVALGRLTPRRRAAAVLALVAGCAMATRTLHTHRSRNGSPYRELGAIVARRCEPDDLVIVQSIPSGVAGVARAAQVPLAGAPGPRVVAWVGQLGGRSEEDLARLAATHRRVMVIEVHRLADDPPAPRWWLEAHAVLERRHERDKALVTEYRTTPVGRQ
ncbi:MAG: glycosyltransferase family 39 protein [Planctomycetes bacterium]|nr:glycosyltransferase family 39 protein [Planctomycetota bacterium]